MKSEDQPNSCIEQEWELRILLALELTLGCKGLGGEEHCQRWLNNNEVFTITFIFSFCSKRNGGTSELQTAPLPAKVLIKLFSPFENNKQ